MEYSWLTTSLTFYQYWIMLPSALHAPAVRSSLATDLWEQWGQGRQQCSSGREVMAAVCSLQGWREVLLCQKPSEIRSAGLSHLHRAQRRKQEKQKGGAEERGGIGERGRRGPKQMCPTTHFGRKQSSTGSVLAQETSCGKVRERRREVY